MDHADHVRLIRGGVVRADGRPIGRTWADLGSGRGAFTLALADLLGPGGTIISVDRDVAALRDQAAIMAARFPSVHVEQRVADFSRDLSLPALDGVVMANSLHFQREKLPVLGLVRGYLRDGGHLVLVEYDADTGNPWVPHPVSLRTWTALAAAAGFPETRRLDAVPSRFLRSIYSAVSVR